MLYPPRRVSTGRKATAVRRPLGWCRACVASGYSGDTSRQFWADAAIDAGAAGVVSYCRSFGEGVTLNRGDDSPRTDSGRQATSCEPTSVSTLGRQNQFATLQSDRRQKREKFPMDDTGQGNAYAFPLFVFPLRHILTASVGIRREVFFLCRDCRAASRECAASTRLMVCSR